MHLVALHDSAGSSNPLGVSGNYDRLPFSPYFIFKDLITIFIFIFVLSLFVFFMPNVLGDSENYVVANPMQTPPAIVPEWYLLPFYAVLRSIPNKLLGVIAMFFAILILLFMPFFDLSKLKGIQFKPLSKITFFVFVINFGILMVLGAKHVEKPFIEFGQLATIFYFVWFILTIPFVTTFENFVFKIVDNITRRKNIGLYTRINNSNNFIFKSFISTSLVFDINSRSFSTTTKLCMDSDLESVDTTGSNVEDSKSLKVHADYLEKKFDGETEDLIEYQRERANKNASMFKKEMDQEASKADSDDIYKKDSRENCQERVKSLYEEFTTWADNRALSRDAAVQRIYHKQYNQMTQEEQNELVAEDQKLKHNIAEHTNNTLKKLGSDDTVPVEMRRVHTLNSKDVDMGYSDDEDKANNNNNNNSDSSDSDAMDLS